MMDRCDFPRCTRAQALAYLDLALCEHHWGQVAERSLADALTLLAPVREHKSRSARLVTVRPPIAPSGAGGTSSSRGSA